MANKRISGYYSLFGYLALVKKDNAAHSDAAIWLSNHSVSYRRIQAGQIAAFHLSDDGKGVDAEIFINAPNDRFVTTELIADFVKRGLRAQPRSESLLTGQLYISLGFIANAAPVPFDVSAQPLIIPTVPGELEKMQEQVQQIIDKVGKVPVQEIAGNLNGSLGEAQKTFRLFNAQVMPELHGVLEQSRSTMDVAGAALAEDSPVRQQIDRTMDEVQRMARSVRVLTDYLSRNPEALIRGRTRQDPPGVYQRSAPAQRPN